MTTPAFTPRPRVPALRVFLALLRRDAHVARKELPFFLLRVTLQPLLFVIVFGFLLPKMGFVQRGYTSALLPGILGISLAFASLQSVALPMVADFGWTREIEDRLLAPVPITLVALEKVLAGIVQGVLAALFVLPLARLIMGPIAGLDVHAWGELIGVTLLAAAAFSTFGLLMGTLIEPAQIGLMFGFIVAPMIFFGCAYYPWQGLSAVPAMKYAVLVNPLVYVSEGMRGAITPTLPHMPLALVLVGLTALTAIFWQLGIRGFHRRAIG
ncbi:MAG: ABC transporter permease [Vicinamibacterales bacterium]